MAKEKFLHIRFSREDKTRVEKAAAANHLDTSTWARQVIMRAVERVERVERELEGEGEGRVK